MCLINIIQSQEWVSVFTAIKKYKILLWLGVQSQLMFHPCLDWSINNNGYKLQLVKQ